MTSARGLAGPVAIDRGVATLVVAAAVTLWTLVGGALTASAQAPGLSVRITSPADGATVVMSPQVRLRAAITYAGDRYPQTGFYVDGHWVPGVGDSATWDSTRSPGPHTITAEVTEDGQTVRHSVTVNVPAPPPSVTLASDSGTQVTPPYQLRVSVDPHEWATDDWSAQSVRVCLRGTTACAPVGRLGTVVSDQIAGANATGEHDLVAAATDNHGASAESSPLRVRVQGSTQAEQVAPSAGTPSTEPGGYVDGDQPLGSAATARGGTAVSPAVGEQDVPVIADAPPPAADVAATDSPERGAAGPRGESSSSADGDVPAEPTWWESLPGDPTSRAAAIWLLVPLLTLPLARRHVRLRRRTVTPIDHPDGFGRRPLQLTEPAHEGREEREDAAWLAPSAGPDAPWDPSARPGPHPALVLAPSAPPTAALPPEVPTAVLPSVGPFQLLKVLGEGGQGSVFLAQSPDDRLVAVKTVPAGDVRALEREVLALRRVRNRHLPELLEADLLSPRPYVAMELILGPTLEAELNRRVRLPEAEVEQIAADLLRALASLHAAGIAHRDVKPANTILARGGAVLVDLGIAGDLARSSTTTAVLGTTRYAAPERLAGQRGDSSCDLYSWARTVCEMLIGVLPIGGDLAALSDRWERLLAPALSNDPAARPSAVELLKLLDATQALDDLPASEQTDVVPTQHLPTETLTAPTRWLT